MDPVDYVYGVLGVSNIKMPRMADPKAVWQRFLSELDKYMDMEGLKNKLIQVTRHDGAKIIRVKKSTYEIDLQEVECMGDVYVDILDTERALPHE